MRKHAAVSLALILHCNDLVGSWCRPTSASREAPWGGNHGAGKSQEGKIYDRGRH